jgi:tetratricopeptide (TPR) repeat protein
MMTASHYLREGDSVRADEYFAALRQNYPDSPHFKNSFILGSHVKLMSYEGANYDSTRLEEAKQLNDSAMRMWPDDELKARLEQEQKIITEAKARREWERVQFYRKKGRLDSAGIYCRELIRLYPDTQYARQAEQFLAANPIPRKANPVPKPETKRGSGGWNWRLFPRLESVPETDGQEEETEDKPNRRFFPLPDENKPYDEPGRAKL